MTKELEEALRIIKIKCHPNSNPSPLVDEALDIVEKALQRLEAIDNANPSEALEKLEECAEGMKDLPKSNWIDLAENEAELDLKIMGWVETIKFELFKGKQALIKAEQLDKILLTPSDNSTFHFDYKDRKMVCMKESHYNEILRQEVFVKSKKELAFDYLIKHFNIECGIDSMPNGEVWARFVHIQAKEDEGEWDTTATVNLVDYEDEFNLLKELV